MPPPQSTPPIPSALKGDRQGLQITWTDGVVQRVLWTTLRKYCPCATCRTKRAEPVAPPPLLAVLKPEETVEVRATRLEPVGNYAYHVNFTDNHSAGIYSFELLRELCDQYPAPPVS